MKPVFRTQCALSALLVLSALSMTGTPFAASLPPAAPVQHVLLISVDGLHTSDLARFIEAHPDSTLAALARQGVDYGNAHTVKPADSFPGLLALVTGGTPAVTGVYYDDSYDRALSAPGSDCSHTGTPIRFDESIDTPAGAGPETIDPAKLPRDARHGCAPVYPHAYLRVNTIFEATREAGGYTAWTDKHPAYELVEGPSGHGVDDLFVPEIGANFEGLDHAVAREITSSLARTEDYDDFKAAAIVHEIDGMTHDGSRRASIPNLFGLNLQAVNVAQKLYGYRDADGTLTDGVDHAIAHADQLIGGFVKELDRQGVRDSTLVIVTAKHGNGPIDPSLLHKIDERHLAGIIDHAAPGALGQLTMDHGALIWLRDASATPAVTAALRANARALGIVDVISGSRLAHRFPAPARDNRTPDIVVVSRNGVIFAPSTDGKLAEHGGFHDDDTRVALLLSNPHLVVPAHEITFPVSTTQVAPTILAALGLRPDSLQAVKQEGTAVLPAVEWDSSRRTKPFGTASTLSPARQFAQTPSDIASLGK
jgi:hypothetical protein